ncbi:hypothetical protein E2562_032529 [Oryza meyeriana var. granulata]|uniref:Uncharacterized protein n=1 Tax=Oryza meyeriana var. granulata TaxID=110450 RepID=A0A6G1DRX7_9ORYZ|nr:hypothetical protein E2562_032529 [Oryza meyeriana var. granulata]
MERAQRAVRRAPAAAGRAAQVGGQASTGRRGPAGDGQAAHERAAGRRAVARRCTSERPGERGWPTGQWQAGRFASVFTRTD